MKDKIIDLDKIMLSLPAAIRWERLAMNATKNLNLTRQQIKTIPDEQARLDKQGNLILFVKLPTGIEISMKLNPGEWSFRQ